MSRIKKMKTPVLHLAWEENGPEKGEPLLLVHGWPDSPRTWDKVLPLLHEAGYTESEFEDAAKSWTGDDFQDVVLHSYRSR